METLPKEHLAFIEYLRDNNKHFTATAVEEHWRRGERYYIDSRVDIRGHRREFNRLNGLIPVKEE